VQLSEIQILSIIWTTKIEICHFRHKLKKIIAPYGYFNGYNTWRLSAVFTVTSSRLHRTYTRYGTLLTCRCKSYISGIHSIAGCWHCLTDCTDVDH